MPNQKQQFGLSNHAIIIEALNAFRSASYDQESAVSMISEQATPWALKAAIDDLQLVKENLDKAIGFLSLVIACKS